MVRIERLTPTQFLETSHSRDVGDHIQNMHGEIRLIQNLRIERSV
jgi:hypothetical protein